MSVIKTRVCYWIHEDLHQEILISTGLRVLSIFGLRYKFISDISIYLFDILREQFNLSSSKPLGHVFSVTFAGTDDTQDKRHQTTFKFLT